MIFGHGFDVAITAHGDDQLFGEGGLDTDSGDEVIEGSNSLVDDDLFNLMLHPNNHLHRHHFLARISS